MDLLKETINREVKKRKDQFERAAKGGDATSQRRKYVRVADLEQASTVDNKPCSSQETASAVPAAAARTAATSAPAHPVADKSGAGVSDASGADVADTPGADVAAGHKLPNDEVIKRLRARTEPIRLFGESDAARRARLRVLELSEESRDGQQNEFGRVMAQVEAGAMLSDLKRQARMTDDDDARVRKLNALIAHDVHDLSPALLRTDIDRVQSLVYVYFKRLLYEWDDFLLSRPDDERRSADGKRAAVTQRQSAEYLRPLFRSLRARSLQPDVLARVTEIARCMLDREYMQANDAYLQLSIGNAPWPIGVTQVGIHSRAARENINADKVAHVLNNETQRKWIQSIKRLIRFAQTKYPPADLAKMVG